MKQKPYAPFAILFIFLLVSLACSAPATRTAIPTQVPPTQPHPTKAPPTEAPLATKAPIAPKPTEEVEKPTETSAQPVERPQAGLQVVSVSGYKDEFDTFHVVGEVLNGENKALSEVELTIEIKDASGNSLLRNDSEELVDSLTFSPMLGTLLSGQSSPFEYTLDSSEGMPDKYDVTVTGQHTAEGKPGQVEIRSARLANDSYGTYYITGELVNTSDKPVEIHTLAGALLDQDKKIIATDWSSSHAAYLEPAGSKGGLDRSPFSISIDKEEENLKEWQTYIDAEQVDPEDIYDVEVNIVKDYFDDYGHYHLVGTVKNNSGDMLHVALVGGLYDKDGVVLDADSEGLLLDLPGGETLPYDLSGFYSLNENKDIADLLDHYTVQIDPYGTYQSLFEVVTLKSTGDTVEKDGATWTIKGEITNDSGKALTSETVVAAVYDAQGKEVGLDWDFVFPPENAEEIAANANLPYEISIDLDPKEDASGYTFKIFAQGDVK